MQSLQEGCIDIDVNYFENTSLSHQYSASRNYFNYDQFNEDFTQCTINSDNNLSVFYLNNRYIPTNGDDLVGYLGALNITYDVICLCETLLNKDKVLENVFPGYMAYHSIREGRHGGDVFIYVRDFFFLKKYTNFYAT